MKCWPYCLAAIVISLVSGISQEAIIDTHIHLYDTSRKDGVPWPSKTDAVLYRPVLKGDFDAIAAKNGVTGVIIVEASDRVEDNQWVLDEVKSDPKKYVGLVGFLPIGTDAFGPALERFSKDPRWLGVRMRQRVGEREFFTDAVWRDLEDVSKRGQVLEVLMHHFTLEDVGRVAKRLPGLKLVINHLAGFKIDGKPVTPEWEASLRKVAALPNVHCKVSGVFQQSGEDIEIADATAYEQILTLLLKSFGEDRLIYGSNWPVTDRRGNYDQQQAVIRTVFTKQGKGALDKLFWKNASRVYGVQLR